VPPIPLKQAGIVVGALGFARAVLSASARVRIVDAALADGLARAQAP
jgi:hypothetical protein